VAQAVDSTLIRENEADLHTIFCIYQLDNEKPPIGSNTESSMDLQLPTPSSYAPTMVRRKRKK